MNRGSNRFAAVAALAVFSGAAFMIWFLRTHDVDHMAPRQFCVPSIILLGATFVCASLMPRLPILAWPAAVFGVMVGVGVNAFTDGRDHNLFPIEMVMWAWFTTPGCLGGAGAAALVRLVMKKRNPA